MGSKNRLAKYILPIILEGREPSQWYVEPFVGGANLIDKVSGKRIGNDNHKYLIALLKALQGGWVPPTTITKEEYYLCKSFPENYTEYYIGFVGFLCSFGGKWWGGYAKDSKGNNYAERGSRVLCKQAKDFKDIEFRCGDYLAMDIPECSIIYCDPPYQGTTKYTTGSFNHTVFWEWCREKTQEGHIVFISEYTAPSDFTCVKAIEHTSILNKNSKDKKIEKLFRLFK